MVLETKRWLQELSSRTVLFPTFRKWRT